MSLASVRLCVLVHVCARGTTVQISLNVIIINHLRHGDRKGTTGNAGYSLHFIEVSHRYSRIIC